MQINLLFMTMQAQNVRTVRLTGPEILLDEQIKTHKQWRWKQMKNEIFVFVPGVYLQLIKAVHYVYIKGVSVKLSFLQLRVLYGVCDK